MTRPLLPILLLGALCASPALAQSIHRCADASGRISYSDMPCAAPPAPKADAVKPKAEAIKVDAAKAKADGVTTERREPVRERVAAQTVQPATPMPSRPAPGAIDSDEAARRANAAQTADCTGALKQMGVAGGGMRLAEAGAARTSAIAKCGSAAAGG